MAIALVQVERSWMARFLATICDVFRALIYLFHTLWTRTTRSHTPHVAELYCKTPLLLDCEKGYGDICQSRAKLLAALKRRDAADAAFEAEVFTLLAPIKQRLAELTRDGSGSPRGTDRTPTPDRAHLCHAGTRTKAKASLGPTHDRETAQDLPPAPQLFCGREQELTALVDAFTPPHARPARIALVGAAPGAGTSTLALAFLHRAETARAFGTRRFLVQSADSAAGDIAGLASALGLPHTPADPVLVLATLAACPLQTLVVLDDVRDTTAILPIALARMPRVSLLLTMQTPVEPASSGSTAGLGHYTALHLGPLLLSPARALFRAIADLPAGDQRTEAVRVDGPTPIDVTQPKSDSDAAFIDALLLRAGYLPRAVVELAQRAQYEPLPFLLARCLEEEENS